MMGWLLLVVFGIIWATFLFPSWRRSPTSTVEQFEERMNLLAEANRASPGRWVLVPKKGHRFLGPLDRQRARTRRRRRFLFVALLELTGLTLIMGLFQPFRAMLVLTVILSAVLVAYVALLLRFRFLELGQAERRRALVSQPAKAYANGARDFDPFTSGNGYGYENGKGNGNGHGHGNGHGNGYAAGRSYGAYPAANGNGSSPVIDEGYLPSARHLGDGGIQIIDEDVHVIVRRSDEVDVQALRAANGNTPE
jgi:hypothetical protein